MTKKMLVALSALLLSVRLEARGLSLLGQQSATPAPGPTTVLSDLLAKGMDPRLWDMPAKRHALINARAKLIALGVWPYVTSIGMAWFETEKTGWLTTRLKTYRIDPDGGFEVAVTTDGDMRRRLFGRGLFWSQFWNHPEARWQLKQVGFGIVPHFLGVRAPFERYTNIHFDAGGGGLNPRHIEDVRKGGGPTQDEITEALLADPKARPHLWGISDAIDAKLAR